jgi:flagellar biosynthesis protein FlhF
MRLRQVSAAEEIGIGRQDAVLGGADAETYHSFEIADDDESACGFPPVDWTDDSDTLIADVLAFHHVAPALSERILAAIASLPGRKIGDAPGDLSAGLAACLGFSPIASMCRVRALALVGPPGAGKTTLAGKLTAYGEGKRPILLDADHERAGAGAQLAEYADVLGTGLRMVETRKAPGAGSRDRRHRLVIDTSGINPFDAAALGHLASLIAATRSEPILVLPANLEPREAVAVAYAFASLPLRRLVVTRLDIVRRLGGLLAAADATGCDLVGASVSPHFAYGLRPLTPSVLARRLIAAALDGSRWQTA